MCVCSLFRVLLERGRRRGLLYIESWERQEFFESIDVHPSEAHRLLEVIDIDGNGKINFEEFLEASMRLNGAARSSDLILLAREMKRFHASQLKYLSDLKSTLLTLRPALM